MRQYTMRGFINKNDILITKCLLVDRNPAMDDFQGNHYKVTLKCGNRQMTLYFSKGYALSGEPTAAEVLDCLASDAVSIENAVTFADWAHEFGYDTDSRKAEKTYKLCLRQTKKLANLISDDDQYRKLLYNVERL